MQLYKKECNKCKEQKIVSNSPFESKFTQCASSKDGFLNRCKKCVVDSAGKKDALPNTDYFKGKGGQKIANQFLERNRIKSRKYE